MQELSKNLLNEHETFESIIDRIIVAIQVGCGFECVRFYRVTDKTIYLDRISEGHDPVEKEKLRLPIDEKDDAAETLFTGEPLLLEDAGKAHLKFREYLNLKGPYAAIPLLVEGKPLGVISANISHSGKPEENILRFPEYFDQVDTFARHIIASVGNRKIFEQRNQNIKQLKLIDKFAKLIQSETEKDKLLNELVHQSVRLVKATGGHLKLTDKQTGEWKSVASYGKDVTQPDMDKPQPLEFSNLVLEGQDALIINDLTKNPLMEKNKRFCKRHSYKEYLRRLENRKSVIIVPLLKHEREVIGVLDVHSNIKDHFSEADKENLKALVNSVISAVDKTQQLERQEELLSMWDKLLLMLKQAVREAHNVNSVLETIRDSCMKLVGAKNNIKIVCLLMKDPHTNELITPNIKCVRAENNCSICLKETPIIKSAFENKKPQTGGEKIAFPILLKDEVIGILYLESDRNIVLNDNEVKILDVIINTAAILITTARNYEIKIKQGTALYEAVQSAAKMLDFRKWFNKVMNKVMEIINRQNRNFHLVMVEDVNGEIKLFVRECSDLFVEGAQPIPFKDKLQDMELSLDGSLSGLVVKKKKGEIIYVEKNKKLEDGHPDKLPYNEYDKRIKSEVVIPLKIYEGKEEEEVIGCLVIDSIIPNDFTDFDWKFHETIASYLAIAIHNQRLYKERARYRETLSQTDRTAELHIILNSFFHDIKDPLQEIQCAFNIAKMCEDEANEKKYYKKAENLSLNLLSISDEFSANFAQTVSERKTVKIQYLITHSLETIEKTRGLDIEAQGNFKESNIKINCFPQFVELAFRDIINNAIKYSTGLKKSERYLKIDIQHEGDDSLEIIFENSTKEPIPGEKLESIFDPFMRGTKRMFGKGLGLSLAGLCIKLHKGEIRAENVKNRKAVRFKITIPKGLIIKTGVLK